MKQATYATILFCLFALVGCNKPSPNTLVIGTISGPETELVEAARQVAKEKYGLTIKIVEFNDYNIPNEALQDGSLDANVYQHLPYLEAASKAHGYHFDVLGKTFIYPTGLYSSKYRQLKKLPYHALIALPNDPSNETRALQLLQQAQLITIKPSAEVTVQDIVSNPRNLQFKELDAAQLPRVLPDVDAAVINTTFAIPAGLNPLHDALIIENKDSPYANLIVIKDKSPRKKQLLAFVDAMHSPAVLKKAKALFGDSALPAWSKSF